MKADTTMTSMVSRAVCSLVGQTTFLSSDTVSRIICRPGALRARSAPPGLMALLSGDELATSLYLTSLCAL